MSSFSSSAPATYEGGGVSAYFVYQAENTDLAYVFVFWFLVGWAWIHAALLWHSVYQGRQGTAIYSAVAFVGYSLGAALWYLKVMPGSMA